MKLEDLKEGDVVLVDNGFTCMKGGSAKAIYMSAADGPYVICEDGRHYLDGQVGEDGHLIGIRDLDDLVESIIVNLDGVQPRMRSEPSAFKRAVMRMAIKEFAYKCL